MYPTLRTGCEKHGRKNPLPFPIFEAVTCRQSAPDYPRERGDSQEGGNRRCLPSCAPARRQRPLPRGAARSRRPQTANPPAEVQRKTPRPLGTNTLTQFKYPAQPVQRKRLPPVRANPPTRFVFPAPPAPINGRKKGTRTGAFSIVVRSCGGGGTSYGRSPTDR